ncbi:MAG: ANTAR domain-containing response regulator [Lachnospiraceae bacterium]|jgi:AmiR/NasT family two-component response regulator
MSLKERAYSILIVSATDAFTSALADLFSAAKYSPIHTVSSVSAARCELTEKTYDFVIINSPLRDDAGIRFAIDTCSNKQSVVLLLVKSDIHNGVHDQVTEYGVFTLSKPISKVTMSYALNWLESARERLRQFEKKSLSIEEKMAEIRLVNKAKWILISQLSMSESEAHRYIEKQAMDRCVTKRTIAEEIIKTYS